MTRKFVIFIFLAVIVRFVEMASAQSGAAPDKVAQEFQDNVQDVYFDFDRADLSAEDRTALTKAAEWLKANPQVSITISGIADERGGVVYNLLLSHRRAEAARDALLQLGVPEAQILFATGWGKLYPACTESTEPCWSQNRRAHMAAWPEGNAWLARGATNWQEKSAVAEAKAQP